MGEDRREDGKLDYQERVTVNWMEEFKTVRSCTLNNEKGFRGCAKEWVILMDMANVGVFKWMNQRANKPPVVVISSDIRTLRDRNGETVRDILTYLYLCAQWQNTEEIEDGEKQTRASELVLIYPTPYWAKDRL